MRKKIHLVTYATRRFWHRQLLLGLSARLNGVTDTVTNWNPKKLRKHGFENRCPSICLNERGSGFWAWKPFIIQEKLGELPDGEYVFYCDVGRRFPYKLLTGTIEPFLDWMDENSQDILPGTEIPWKGHMSMWTKREAFVAADLDSHSAHHAIPIQASFSIWRSGKASENIAAQWMDMASKRNLISDDPSKSDLPELPDFHDHRHDQSLLTLCCIKNGLKGLRIGETAPPIDTQHPSEVASIISPTCSSAATILGNTLRLIIKPLELCELKARTRISFGEPLAEPSVYSQKSEKQ